MTVIPLRVGDLLEGFCEGMFGRDSYGAKRVEGVGNGWVVAREVDSGTVVFASADDTDQLSLVSYRIAEVRS